MLSKIGIVLCFLSSTLAYGQQREFGGINFGAGLSLTFDTGHHDRVKEAIIDEAGIVRVTEESNFVPRIVLESHYFFPDAEQKCGYGPFVAIQPGTDDIINAIGFGFMVGFRKDSLTNQSWNIGVAFVIDPSVKVLGDGVIENNPLPSGETQIRFLTKEQAGIMFVASFAF